VLGSSDLVAFVATTDLERAAVFYRATLGLSLVEQNPGARVFDAHGTALRVTVVGEVAVAPYTVLGWNVADIVATMGALGAAGVRFDQMGQDDNGVWTSPGGDLVAWFRDPDANILSLTQPASPG
jgi:catechol 2,3-dioxygenase-like lactoylglutathione lyase family enzyme